MLLINLIAARRAERRKREMMRAVLVRAMAGTAVAALTAVLFMTISIQRTNARIADVDTQIQLLDESVTQVEHLQAQLTALAPRVTTLVDAQNATNRWRAAMQEVSMSLPDKTWITSFQSKSGQGEGFVVTGRTVNQERVGRTMLKMNKTSNLENVDLNFTQNAQEGNAINFEVTGSLAGTKTDEEAQNG